MRLSRFPIVLFSAAAAAFAVVACGDDPVAPKDPTELTFATGLNVNLDEMIKTASGLYYQDLVFGTGEMAEVTDEVTVHYTGSLHTGEVFDSTDGGDPVSFSLAQVIAGWREGVAGMQVGGIRKLVIPHDLAYGKAGIKNVIPKYATLVFDVELVGIVQ